MLLIVSVSYIPHQAWCDLNDSHVDIKAMQDRLSVAVVVCRSSLIYVIGGSEDLWDVGVALGYLLELVVSLKDADWCLTAEGFPQMHTRKHEYDVLEIFCCILEYIHFESSQSIDGRD